MPSEFGRAFDAWMESEGFGLVPAGLAPAGQSLVVQLMKLAWLAGGVAADQQQLDKMKAQETKP